MRATHCWAARPCLELAPAGVWPLHVLGGWRARAAATAAARSRDARSADPLRRVSSTSSARSNPWLSPLLRRWIGAARRHRARCGGTVARCPRCGSWSSGASSEVTCLAVTEGRLSGRALRVHTRASHCGGRRPQRRHCGGATPTRWVPRATCLSFPRPARARARRAAGPSPCSQLIRPRRRAGCRPRAGQVGTCEGTNIATTCQRHSHGGEHVHAVHAVRDVQLECTKGAGRGGREGGERGERMESALRPMWDK